MPAREGRHAVSRELRGSRHGPRATSGARKMVYEGPRSRSGSHGRDLENLPAIYPVPTASVATSCATCASCSSTCSIRRGEPDGRLAVLRSARRAAGVPRLAVPVTAFSWTSTAGGREARAREARRRSLSHPRHERGLTMFLRLFTGQEPDIEENAWPFKGFRLEGEGAEEGARIGSTRWCYRRSTAHANRDDADPVDSVHEMVIGSTIIQMRSRDTHYTCGSRGEGRCRAARVLSIGRAPASESEPRSWKQSRRSGQWRWCGRRPEP